MPAESRKLQSLTTQITELPDSVVLKRALTELRVGGVAAGDYLRRVMSAAQRPGATAEEIVALFEPEEREIIEELIERLVERRLLVDADEAMAATEEEDALDLFCWNFGISAQQLAAPLTARRIAVVGVNAVTSRLVLALHEAGVRNVRIIDDPMLRNERFFDRHEHLRPDRWPLEAGQPLPFDEHAWPESVDGIGCLVAASDFGGMHLLERWNGWCLERKIHFLPLLLRNLVGHIGPLVIPGETACLTCLWAREESSSPMATVQRAIDADALRHQSVAGHFPSMASILGDIAVMELIKFYNLIGGWRVGSVIDVNLLRGTMTPRKVLKIPRCRACSSLNRLPSREPRRLTFAETGANRR